METMKKVKQITHLVMLSATLWSISVFGQISQGGVPISLKIEDKSQLSEVPVKVMPEINVEALRAEDAIFDQLKDRPWRYGIVHQVSYSPENSGVTDILEDGTKIWRLGIVCPGALSINILFKEYEVPKGARLFIYSANGKEILGAFTDFNNQPDRFFATSFLFSEHVIVEYNEPKEVDFEGKLTIGEITHGYRTLADYVKSFGQSGSCNVNVACPQAAGMENQIRSVAMIASSNGVSQGFCSGALINNTNNDGTPYFLTANHCGSSSNYPAGSSFYIFNWQSATCSNPASSPAYQSISGGTTKAYYSTSDFWLIQLNTAPPSNYNPYYSGWNRTTQSSITGKIWGIHHPSGDIKKISWSNNGVTTTAYGGGSGTTHWKIVWSDGTTTEGGSSGSPLFDTQGKIIGQLHGGAASCTNPTGADYYGKLGVSWTGGGSNTTRLSNWLDPTNSGATEIEGYDPYAYTCTPPTQQASNFIASDVQDNQLTISWQRGNGTGVIVLARAVSAISNHPVNGVNYTANSTFGSGSAIGSGFVVYKGTGTSVTVTNLLPGTTYHFGIYEFFTADNCYSSNPLTGSQQTTGTAPCNYCTVSATNDDNTGITRVSFNTINNTSPGTPSYSDFTNQSTVVQRGNTYTLSVWVNTDGNYTVQTKAWIDWNQNCEFETSEEYNLGSVTNNQNGLTSLSPLNITVPNEAALGQTRMRIRAVYGTTVNPAACGNQNYSEAEDYTINVLSAGVYANFTASPTTVEVGQPVTFTDASGGGQITSWQWNFGEGASPATAASQGPHQVVYTTTGQKTVSLTVNNNITETKPNFITVTAPCTTINTFPWEEIFNQASLPNCWAIQQTHPTNTWTSTTGYNIGTSTTVAPHTGSHFWYVPWITANQSEWLLTPVFDFTNLSEPTISFWFNGSYHWSVVNNNCDLDLMVKVNNGPWTKIWGETDHPEWTSTNVNYVWLQTILPLTQYAGQNNVRFAFRYTGNDGANFAIDNIRVWNNQTTPTTYNLTINTIGQGTVNVNGNVYTTPLTFNEGTVVTIQALASTGWQFESWSGDATGATNPISVTMDGNKTITATFIQTHFTVTFNVKDQQNQPLQEANITITPGNISLNTNTSGIATTQLQNGSYTINVFKSGYIPYEGQFTVAGSAIDLTITLNAVTVETISANNIHLYPNPAAKTITLVREIADNATVTIYNFNGTKMKMIAWDETTLKIDISNFPAGIYLIQIDGNSSSSLTFTKQ